MNTLSETHVATLNGLYDKIAKTWNAGDRSYYLEVHQNCTFMAPNAEALTSREDIQAFVDAFPPGTAQFTVDQISGNTGLAVVQGKYAVDNPDGSVLDQGKFIGVYEMTASGEFEMTHAIWNTSLPQVI